MFSTDEQIELFANEISPVLEDFAFGNKQEIFNIKSALIELLINAQEHGNKFETGRKIFIEWEMTSESLTFSIEDEGNGPPHTIPTQCPPLSNARGRGLWLIVETGFTLFFNERGNKVIMVVKTKGANHINSDVSDKKENLNFCGNN
ncbi:MAG: ATP-binding protein [Nitrospirae bacterium]|nr:ATP-binding protein [Nitrospirota bacterium]